MRYEPNYNEGLNSEQVNKRIEENLVNFNCEPTTKTTKQILKDNIFTYFNIVNSILCILMIIAGIIGLQLFEALKNSTFMGVLIFNTIISTIQEMMSKKVGRVLCTKKAFRGKMTNLSSWFLRKIKLKDRGRLTCGSFFFAPKFSLYFL